MSSGQVAEVKMISPDPASAKSFLLQRVQPAMTGLIDGSLSTLAPIFAVARALGYERRDLASLFEVLARLAGAPA